jgi:hypothetical protein
LLTNPLSQAIVTDARFGDPVYANACSRQLERRNRILFINMRSHFLTCLLICAAISTPLSARLPVSPGFEDIRNLAEHAPLVFRGQVEDLILARNQPEIKEGVAVISVDRWYRGSQSVNSVKVHFVYNAVMRDGHDCVNFEIGTYWIVFAIPGERGVLDLSHDCEGALVVSSLLGPEVSTGLLSQMEVDFAAGLSDSDSATRIASIQRLAGLGQISSAEGLHHVIARGTEEESKWAIFAALKTGDASVLPLAVPILLNLHHEEAQQVREPNGFVYTRTHPYPQPEGLMALAISDLRAPEAVPSLRKLANEASDDLVRDCASQALREIGRQLGEHKK